MEDSIDICLMSQNMDKYPAKVNKELLLAFAVRAIDWQIVRLGEV